MKRCIILCFLLSVLMLCAAAGCAPSNGDDQAGNHNGNDDPNGENGAVDDGNDDVDDDRDNGDPGDNAEPGDDEPEPSPRYVTIKLYFSDKEAIETGVPGETGFVKAVTRQYPETLGVLRLALEELIKGPRTGEGNLGPTLPESTRVLNLKIEDGVAVIDLSEEVVTDPGAPGGSFGGGVFIQSIVYTATQFPTVDAATVTVNGEPWSDGHSIWDRPIGRDDVNISQ